MTHTLAKISDEHFALLCFLVLMRRSLLEEGMPHPNYFFEKAVMIKIGQEAFAFLDFNNMSCVILYLNRANIEIPEKVKIEYDLQKEAFNKFRD